ncbi:MAG TPA: hypothetical protein VJA94_11835 [Candidatus Angelobacter sp.]
MANCNWQLAFGSWPLAFGPGFKNQKPQIKDQKFPNYQLTHLPTYPFTKSNSGILWLGASVVLHLGRPLEEALQLSALAEHESPKFNKAYLVHPETCVSFHAPAQIGTAPGHQMVPSCGIPEKTQDSTHIQKQRLAASSQLPGKTKI